MSTDDLVIAPLGEGDLEPLAAFMREQNNAATDAGRLRHWYLDNPAGRATVIVGRIGGRIVGMSTTNAHRFRGPEGEALVAMPQKVLTDASVRGRGIFQRLYHATEQAARAKGAGFLLTVTNAASTPIFLGRFGYVRLPVPRMLVWPALPGGVRGEVPPDAWAVHAWTTEDASVWHLSRDAAHLHWRYSAHPDRAHEQHAFATADGHARIVLKRIQRKGLPVMLLLELVATDPGSARMALRDARHLAWRNGCIALMGLRTRQLLASSRGTVHLTVSSGFNLLVKGLDEGATARLSAQPFELALGDLDFL